MVHAWFVDNQRIPCIVVNMSGNHDVQGQRWQSPGDYLYCITDRHRMYINLYSSFYTDRLCFIFCLVICTALFAYMETYIGLNISSIATC